MKSLLIICFIIFALISTTPADQTTDEVGFDTEFLNTTDEKLVYIFYWIDHPFKGKQPANMAAGELAAGASRGLASQYIPGLYGIIWTWNGDRKNAYMVEIKSTTKLAIFTPEKCIQF